jgi:hypothetical protein
MRENAKRIDKDYQEIDRHHKHQEPFERHSLAKHMLEKYSFHARIFILP